MTDLAWQPIETAPKDGTRVLLTDGKKISIGCWEKVSDPTYDWTREQNTEECDKEWGYPGWWDHGSPPILWMSLPALPEKDQIALHDG